MRVRGRPESAVVREEVELEGTKEAAAALSLLHVFCDASSNAYAECAYVVNEASGQKQSSLRMTRVMDATTRVQNMMGTS